MGRAEQCVTIVGFHFCGCGDENVFDKRHQMKMVVNCGKIVMECKLKIDVMAIKGIRIRPSCGLRSPRATRRLFSPETNSPRNSYLLAGEWMWTCSCTPRWPGCSRGCALGSRLRLSNRSHPVFAPT